MDHDSFLNNRPVFVVTIVNRGMGEKAAAILTDEGAVLSLLLYATGTAPTRLLDYLGLGETEKDLLLSAMPHDASKGILERLETEIDLSRTGHGIAFSLQIGGVCGGRAAGCPDGAPQGAEKEDTMESNAAYDLILTVADRGFTDEIMEAARSAKAGGGTALHARQVGIREAESFFGVTIQPEKEVILILTTRENRQGILQAITEQWGPRSKAKAIAFSLPVSDVAGVQSSLLACGGRDSGN